MSEFNDLQTRIGRTNEKSGFNEAQYIKDPVERRRYWSEKLLLTVSEVTEAQDELRKGHDITHRYLSYPPTPTSLATEFASGEEATEHFQSQIVGKPEGAPSEMADAVIRLFGIAYEAGFDLLEVIEHKLEYNATREYMHGKKF